MCFRQVWPQKCLSWLLRHQPLVFLKPKHVGIYFLKKNQKHCYVQRLLTLLSYMWSNWIREVRWSAEAHRAGSLSVSLNQCLEFSAHFILSHCFSSKGWPYLKCQMISSRSVSEFKQFQLKHGHDTFNRVISIHFPKHFFLLSIYPIFLWHWYPCFYCFG